EEGGVVGAGGEDDDGGIDGVRGGNVFQRVEKIQGIIFDGSHAVLAEEVGEDALHDGAVFQHIADAAGGAAVVFQDVVIAIFAANQIGAADVDVDFFGDIDVEHFAAEHFGAVDQLVG